MPIHDWTQADAGCFRHFHLTWACRLTDTLNRGLLPKRLTALLESSCGWPIPDRLTEATA